MTISAPQAPLDATTLERVIAGASRRTSTAVSTALSPDLAAAFSRWADDTSSPKAASMTIASYAPMKAVRPKARLSAPRLWLG
jgi:hypothetical protein